MSSASRGSGTRRRMKLRSRDCSRLTTSAIGWSSSSAIRSKPGLAASFIYGCRRMRGCGYCRVARATACVAAQAENVMSLRGLLVVGTFMLGAAPAPLRAGMFPTPPFRTVDPVGAYCILEQVVVDPDDD